MESSDKFFGCLGLFVIGLIVSAGLIACSGAQVSYGHVGVVTTWGAIEKGQLQPGFHVVVPIAQRIESMNVQVQPHPFKEIDAASREMQSVKLTGMMNFHIDAARADSLLATVGKDFAEKVIDPAFNDFIKEVVPRYEANSILQRRDEIRSEARTKLQANLERYGIIVDDIYISNISFSNEYQGAIEGKQTAQQQVEKEAQVLAQKRIQADQMEADALGQARAEIARAQGTAKANELLAQSITPNLVNWEYLQRWDGKRPQVEGAATPLVQLPALPKP